LVVGVRAIAENALALEQVGYGAVGTEISTSLGKRVTHFRYGTILVVGQAVNHDGHAVRAVAFVTDFLVVFGFSVTGAALDSALDVVFRHVGRQGLVDRQPQARIAVRVAAAHARGDRQFTNQAREYLAAFLVLRILAVLNIGPFAVTCHRR